MIRITRYDFDEPDGSEYHMWLNPDFITSIFPPHSDKPHTSLLLTNGAKTESVRVKESADDLIEAIKHFKSIFG